MVARTSLSAAEARRVALAAQGFARPRPNGRVDRRHVRTVFEHVGLIQIDSVNVLVRAQELPLHARLGGHRRDLLDTMVGERELFEYWGHAASLLPIELYPLVRWRMERAREEVWGSLARLADDKPGYIDAVLDEVRDRGPLTAGELSDPGRKSGPWWGWNHGKQALEYLFWCGRIAAYRGRNFERVYDLTERVIPPAVLSAAVPSPDDAKRELLAKASRSLGVATVKDLADYYRIGLTVARRLVQELVEAGRLVPVAVEGWKEPAYLHPDASCPKRIAASALVSPFDSLVWERDRNVRLFGFHYRIEIYTPAHKRTFGYYVLPYLLGDDLVARVDLKADRAASALLVQAAHAEPGCDQQDVADALGAELRSLANWLELEDVTVVGRGDLSRRLTATTRRSPAAATSDPAAQATRATPATGATPAVGAEPGASTPRRRRPPRTTAGG